jgi:hypothetical protein
MRLLLLALALCSVHAQQPSDPVSVVFMPYYSKEQMGKEVEAINNVTMARMLDKRANFSRDDNPYRVSYAVYNFAPEPMWQDLVSAFLNARAHNVEVQLLVDAKQLQSFETWNKGLQTLIKAGLRYSPTQINLTVSQQKNLELIGVNTSLRGNGLMHLKTRLFQWLEPESKAPRTVLMTGSFNPEIGPAPAYSFMNNDTFLEIRDPKTIKKYQNKYNAVRANKMVVNEWDDDSQVNVLFSPDPEGPLPVNQIMKWIGGEDELIFIWVFTLRNLWAKNNVTLFDSLIAAKERGASIVVATDLNMVENSTHQLNRHLREHGIPVYLCNNTAAEFVAMHAKNAMLGITKPLIITDTCNWTGGALTSWWLPVAINDESTLWINATKNTPYGHLGVEFTSNFMAILRSYQDQPANKGQPSVQAIVDSLNTNVKAWRQINMSFQVSLENVTDTAEGFKVIISLRSIPGSGGAEWEFEREMVKRGEEEAVWVTSSPIQIPHGRTFAYKFGKAQLDSPNVIWETCKGGGRSLIADPAFPSQANVKHVDLNKLAVSVECLGCSFSDVLHL